MTSDEVQLRSLVERIEQTRQLSGPISHERISHPVQAIQYRTGSTESEFTSTHYVMLHEQQIVLIGCSVPVEPIPDLVSTQTAGTATATAQATTVEPLAAVACC